MFGTPRDIRRLSDGHNGRKSAATAYGEYVRDQMARDMFLRQAKRFLASLGLDHAVLNCASRTEAAPD